MNNREFAPLCHTRTSFMEKQIMKRIINLVVPRKREERRPNALFWQALLDVHHVYFESALIDFWIAGRPQQHIYWQLCTLDCWLDVAIEEGWIEDDHSKE